MSSVYHTCYIAGYRKKLIAILLADKNDANMNILFHCCFPAGTGCCGVVDAYVCRESAAVYITQYGSTVYIGMAMGGSAL